MHTDKVDKEVNANMNEGIKVLAENGDSKDEDMGGNFGEQRVLNDTEGSVREQENQLEEIEGNTSDRMELEKEKFKGEDKMEDLDKETNVKGAKEEPDEKSMDNGSEGEEFLSGNKEKDVDHEMPTVLDDMKIENSHEDSDEEGVKKKRISSGSKIGKIIDEHDKKVVKQQGTPVTSTERPVRERKSVERLVTSMKRDEVKDLVIEQGPGTPLRDIPNVAYKLSKRKVDDTLKMLHVVLFGRKGKLQRVKVNVSKFSGFVWRENEENQKAKLREKFDKWNKDKLFDACYVLDIPVAKTATRKEDVITKLMDFLEAPHPTTTTLLVEKGKLSNMKKRKRVTTPGASSGGKRPVKRKSKDTSEVREEDVAKEKEDTDVKVENEDSEREDSLHDKSIDDMDEQSESDEKDDGSEYDSDKDKGKRSRGAKSSSVKKGSADKGRKRSITPKESSSTSKKASYSRRKKGDVAAPKPASKEKTGKKAAKEKSEEHEPAPKSVSRQKIGKKAAKVKSEEHEPMAEEAAPKSTSKEKIGKRAPKDKSEEHEPADDELRNAICGILKEVDFNKATFTDILKQLAVQFKTDLMPRKTSIRLMIEDELTKLADEEGDEDDDGDKGEVPPPSQEVKT